MDVFLQILNSPFIIGLTTCLTVIAVVFIICREG